MKLQQLLFALLISAFALTAKAQESTVSVQDALNPDGTLREGVSGSFNGEGYTTGTNGQPIFTPITNSWSNIPGIVGNVVQAIGVSGNDIYVGGGFTPNPVSFLGRWNKQTQTWSALGSGVNNTVFAITISGSKVYVGGAFTQAGGNPANRVAVWDTQTQTWSALGSGLPSTVSAIAISGNDVYVGGAGLLSRWNTQTQTWTSLLSPGSSNVVTSIVAEGDNLYVGGDFEFVGNFVQARSIARWNRQSNQWSALGSGLLVVGTQRGTVSSMALIGNELYVSGNFFQAGSVFAGRLAKWNTTNSTWSSVFSVEPINSPANAILGVGNDVFLGGNFTLAGGTAINRIVRFNTATNSWIDLGGANAEVFSLALDGNQVVAGGAFTQIAGNTVNRLAAFSLAPVVESRPVTNITSTAATLNGVINPNGFTLSVARFEYSLDPSLTTGVLNVNTTPNAVGIGNGTSPVSVSANITLQQNSTYYYRMRATSINGTTVSQVGVFSNMPPPPAPVPRAGLQLWLRADSLVTRSNGFVTQWGDLSGSNRNALSVAPATPAYVASNTLYGGRPVIDFGTGGDKQLGFRRISDVRTAFIVARSTTPTTFQFLFGDSTSFQFHPTNTNLVDPSFAAAVVRNGQLFLNGQSFGPTTVTRPANPTIIMYETTGNAETSTIARDRTLADNRGWRGEVAEVIIYNRVLPVAERAQVQSYLAQRYSIGAQSTSANPSVPASTFGTYMLGNTGATVTFTTPSTTTGSLSGSVTNARPNIVGTLPTGIVNLSERFWTINQTNLTGFNCAVTFNLSTLGGVQNFNTLKVLRRNNASSPWVDVESLAGVTISRNEPFITVAGITSFSDFAIGSDASNQLPVELTDFGRSMLE